MEFGFFSLLPPIVAIILAVSTRKVVLPLAAGVAVGAILLSFGRVSLQTDLGTNGKVRVRFVAPSPILSGTSTFVSFQSSKLATDSILVSVARLSEEGALREQGVNIVLNSSESNESTVSELLDAVSKEVSADLGLKSILEFGDPNILIGRNFDSPQRLVLGPPWTFVGTRENGFFLPSANQVITGIINSVKLFFDAIYHSIVSISHLQAFIFSLLLAAMVGTLEAGGGIRVLIERVSQRVKTRRGAQTMIATSGLAVFFDDYANTLLLGGTMRSTEDRYKISRQKLAYFVDSTAAPVAGLALVSTWTAIEISYLADGLTAAGIQDPQAAFELFLKSIPYRFYPWLALVMVFCIAWSQRDFGPMLQAEREFDEQTPDPEKKESKEHEKSHPKLWTAAVAPVFLCLAAVLVVLVITGREELSASDQEATNAGLLKLVGEVLGNGDSYLALMVGGAVGLACAISMHTIMGSPIKVCLKGAAKGARQILPAMAILCFAWALSGMTEKEDLDTGGYLAGLLSNQLPVALLPSIVFLVAAIMAFSTGTSWGTIGILTPISVGLAIQLDFAVEAALNSSIVLATSGSVLAGAIFGDHCSPISDTTVLSSRASGCDHIAHVRTQMPYALVVGAVSILLGTIPAAFGLSPWICLLLGSSSIYAVVRVAGRVR